MATGADETKARPEGTDEFLKEFGAIVSDDANSLKAMEFYSKKVELYAKVHNILGNEFYRAPLIVAEATSKYLGTYHDARIIDVACGTGQVAEELHSRGFANIDGLDPNKDMLEYAASKTPYRHLFNVFLDDTSTAAASDGVYDVACCAGGFVPGHIPAEGLRDMVNKVKQGGFVINAMREAYIDHPFYKNKLMNVIAQLKEEKLIEVKEISPRENHFNGLPGLLMVFEKL